MKQHGWLADELVEDDETAKSRQTSRSWVERIRSGEEYAYGAIVAILALFLLPLVVGPFVAAWQFAMDGEYAGALFLVSLFNCLALVAIRAVRRGEFGPGIFFLAVGLVIGAVLLAVALSKVAVYVLGR